MAHLKQAVLGERSTRKKKAMNKTKTFWFSHGRKL